MTGKQIVGLVTGLIVFMLIGVVLWQVGQNSFLSTSTALEELPPITDVKDDNGVSIVTEPEQPDEVQTEPGDTPPPDEVVDPEGPMPPEWEPVACTLDAKQCPDGSYVGRVAPDCEFAVCPQGEVVPPDGPTPPEIGTTEVTYCNPNNRPEMCYDLYAPVCGLVQVQCITTPCDPVPETFSNDCNACAQSNVISYTEGACEG